MTGPGVVGPLDPHGGARASLTGVARALALAWRWGRFPTLCYTVVTLLAAAVPVGLAWLTKLVLDAVAGGAATGGRLAVIAVGLAAAGLAAVVLPHTATYSRQELDRRVGLAAQDQLFAAAERHTGLARFEDPGFLNRIELAHGAGGSAPSNVVTGGLSVGQGVITVVGFLGSLLVVSPWLAVAVLVAAVPALLAELHLSRQRAGMMWRVSPVQRRELVYRQLLTSPQAAKELRLFGTTRYFRERMTGERRRANAEERRVDRRELGTHTLLGVLSAGIAGAGLVWAVFAAVGGRLSAGDVTLLIAAIAGVQAAVARLVGDVMLAHHHLVLFDHFLAVTRDQPDLPVPARPSRTSRLRRGIEIDGVWFRYSPQHPWALRDICLRLPHGQAVALVGRNGAGKSTLVKLLCRLYDPQRGAIRWDGIDLRELDPAELRRRIGVVFQDYMEYDVSAADNIGFGDLARLQDRAGIEAAARRAGVHEALVALPRGYDTLLSRIFAPEGDPDRAATDPGVGVMLSGGQWQRLALARALLREEPDLLILDEPSSGLDAEAEHEIHTRIRAHRAGRTSVLISHRLGAVRDADRLVVLDAGRVAEQGSHAELLAAEGIYAGLFHLQADGYRAGPHPEEVVWQ